MSTNDDDPKNDMPVAQFRIREGFGEPFVMSRPMYDASQMEPGQSHAPERRVGCLI
jgi:hypothetical protein